MYVGTYTGPHSQGIYAYRFDAATGQATPLGLVAETANPSFLAIDPTQRFLYAANEVSDYQGSKESARKENGKKKTGAISAFAIDPKSGKLSLLNQVSSHGAGPCYVSLDQAGKYVLAANYGGGSVAVFPVLKDGRLREASSVIEHTGPTVDPLGAEPHQIDLSGDNRFATASTPVTARWRRTIRPSHSFLRSRGRGTSPLIPTTSSSMCWKKRLRKSTDFLTKRQPELYVTRPQFQLCPKAFRGTTLPRKSGCTLTANSSIARIAATTASPPSPSIRQPACRDSWKPSQAVARSRATLKSRPAVRTWSRPIRTPTTL
jgi:Lactonase, 7-bladed beta-propeller